MLSLDSNRSAAEDYNRLELCYREIATSFATLDYLPYPYNILNKMLRRPHTFWTFHCFETADEFNLKVSVKVKCCE